MPSCDSSGRKEKLLLLELGAATGSDAAAFSAEGVDVVCVDLSPEMAMPYTP